MRKLMTIIATLALLAALPMVAQAQTSAIPALTKQAVFTIGSKTVQVDGQSYQMDVTPHIDSANRTQVPVRYLGNVLGMQAYWDAKAQQVTLSENKYSALETLTIGSNKLGVSNIVNTVTTMDTTPVIVPPGRTNAPGPLGSPGHGISGNLGPGQPDGHGDPAEPAGRRRRAG